MKKHFKHTKSNHFHPRYLSVLVFALFGLMLVNFDDSAVKGYATQMSVSDLTAHTNQYRQENGLKPLLLNQELSAAAQEKAKHMKSQGYWSHVAPDGTTPWQFIDQTGLEYFKAGENLAHGFKNPDATVKAWWGSESHRANIMDLDYDEVGFAYIDVEDFKGNPTTIVVAMYADTDGLTTQPNVAANQSSEINVVTAAINGQTDSMTNLVLIISMSASFGYIKKHGKHAVDYVHKGEKVLKAHPMLEASLVYAAILAILTTTYGAVL